MPSELRESRESRDRCVRGAPQVPVEHLVSQEAMVPQEPTASHDVELLLYCRRPGSAQSESCIRYRIAAKAPESPLRPAAPRQLTFYGMVVCSSTIWPMDDLLAEMSISAVGKSMKNGGWREGLAPTLLVRVHSSSLEALDNDAKRLVA